MTAGMQAPQASAVKRAAKGTLRRDALRRFGIAAGVAWTAPVVMSLYSPAGRADGRHTGTEHDATTAPPDLECVGTTCGAFEVCSHGEPDDESDDCVCVTTADGLGLCTPGSLSCTGLEECGPGNSCPPGTTCARGSTRVAARRCASR